LSDTDDRERLFGGTNILEAGRAAVTISEEYLEGLGVAAVRTDSDREVAQAIEDLWLFASLSEPDGSPRFPLARASIRSPDSQRLLALMADNATRDPAKLQTLKRYIALLVGTDVREILGR